MFLVLKSYGKEKTSLGVLPRMANNSTQRILRSIENIKMLLSVSNT